MLHHLGFVLRMDVRACALHHAQRKRALDETLTFLRPPPHAQTPAENDSSRKKQTKKNRRLKDEVTIHTERVEGYSQSLRDDALREVREREEEAERARQEEEQRLAREALEAKEREDAKR